MANPQVLMLGIARYGMDAGNNGSGAAPQSAAAEVLVVGIIRAWVASLPGFALVDGVDALASPSDVCTGVI
jgi:hypothetical protein